MATNAQIREVGLIVKANTAALKTAVDAVNTALTAMTFDALDAALPTAVALKAQLTAYDAIAKPANTLSEALTAIRTVE